MKDCFDVNIKTDNTLGANGKTSYQGETSNISINAARIGEDASLLEKTILHELTHAVTAKVIHQYNTDKTSLNKSLQEKVGRLDKFYKSFIERVGQEKIDAMLQTLESTGEFKSAEQRDIIYGGKNLREFTALAMSSPEFQAFMKDNFWTEDTNKTIWQKFVDYIQSILTELGINWGQDINPVIQADIMSLVEEQVQVEETIPEHESLDTLLEMFKKEEPIIPPKQEVSGGKIAYGYNHTLSSGKVITLNNQQVDALNNMFRWEQLPANRKHLEFLLAGYAGTGKTTIAKIFVDSYRGAIAVSAPTHKAKKVAAKAIGKKAETIHSLLGLQPNVNLENFDVNNPQFDPLAEPKIDQYSMIIIDEASMINKGLYKLLVEKAEAAGTRLLFMGDNAQLPPINEIQSEVFTKVENANWLTQVERTANDNPLRAIFTSIRENINSTTDTFKHITNLLGDGRGVEFTKDREYYKRSVFDAFKSKEYKESPFTFAKFLAYENEAVGIWNRYIRAAIFGETAKLIEVGDLIMAYTNIKGKNPAKMEFENSADYKAINVSEGVEGDMKVLYVTLQDDTGDITSRTFIDHTDETTVKQFQVQHNALLAVAKAAPRQEKRTAWGAYYRFRESKLTLVQVGNIQKSADYAYGVTVHKSQGSTYNNVFVLESNIDKNQKDRERNQMKYVAFTRASDKVFSFTPKTEEVQDIEQPSDYLPGVSNYIVGIDYGVVADTVERQIRRLYERLSQLSRREAATKDVVQLKAIRKEILDINKKIEDKKLQLDEAKQATKLEDLAKVIKAQVDEAEQIILNNPTLSADQLAYFNKTLNLAVIAGDFSSTDHILFTELEMQSPHLRTLFEGLSKRAADLLRETGKSQEELMKVLINETTGKDLTPEEFLKSIEDASGIKTNSLNLSRLNDPLLAAIFIRMKEAQFQAHKAAQQIFDKTDELLDAAIPVLESIDSDDPFGLFKQRTKSGKLTGNIVFRYSDEYFRAKEQVWSGAFNTNGSINQLGYATALAWGKDNTAVFDVRKLFPTAATDSFQWVETFTQAEIDAHVTELQQQLGVDGYNLLYSHLQNKLERFQMLHETVVDEINTNPAILDKQLQIEYWEKSNSPYWASKSRVTGQLVRMGNNVVSTNAGMNYTYVVPRKTTLSGRRTEWYDSQFEQIEANPALLEFYNYFLETLSMLNKMIPAYKREGYQINTLPTIRKDILEQFRDNPRLIGSEVWGKVIEATRVENLAQTDYSEVDPITGKGDPRVVFHNVDTRQAIKDLIQLKRIEWEQSHPRQTPTIQLARQWREEAMDEIAHEKSFDLGKVLRAYSMQVLAYHHKATTENLLNIAVNAFNERDEVVTNAAGEVKGNVRGFERSEEGLENLKAALDYQMRVYANLPRHTVELKTEKIMLTPKEKEEIARIEELLAKNEELRARGQITQKKYDFDKAVLEKQRDDIGGVLAGSRIGDMVLQWVQLLGMGWNLVGAFANRAYGKMTNWTEAADGRLFSFKELKRAELLTMNSMARNFTFNKWDGVNEVGLKIRKLMDKFDVLQETRNELYKASIGSRFLRKFKWLNPYQLNSRTEYLNQAEPFVARLLRIKVSDFVQGYTGVETLWDAYDTNGNWNIAGVEEPDLTPLQVSMDGMINRLHGDYSNPQKGKEGLFGRALFQFRTWMAEMVFARFGAEWEDHIDGIIRKGRYKSMTPLSHLITAGTFVGVAFGAPGILVGGTIGLLSGRFFGMKSPMSMSEELLFNLRVLLRKAQLSDQFNSSDAANIRSNFMELAILMSIAGLGLIVKAGLDDDDEYEKYAANFLLNQMTRMQTDILFYTNPLEFEKLSKNALPAFGLIADVSHWLDATSDTINGEGTYKTGIHKGDSKMWRWTKKLIPGLRQTERLKSTVEQVYQ